MQNEDKTRAEIHGTEETKNQVLLCHAKVFLFLFSKNKQWKLNEGIGAGHGKSGL